MPDEARKPSETTVVLSQAMAITDANLAGNVHGGVIMKLADTAAGLSAVKHCRSRVVTVAMDEMVFIEPVYLSDVVSLRAQVNDVGRTSMEVGVRVEAEPWTGGARRHTTSAYLTMVALGPDGKPVEVPPLVPETDEEQRRCERARIRREMRKERIQRLDTHGPGPATEPQPDDARG